jgi:hypothetical protein
LPPLLGERSGGEGKSKVKVDEFLASLIGSGLFLTVPQKLLVASISGLKTIDKHPKKWVRP